MIIDITELFRKHHVLQLLDELMMLLRAGYRKTGAYELVRVEHIVDIRIMQIIAFVVGFVHCVVDLLVLVSHVRNKSINVDPNTL